MAASAGSPWALLGPLRPYDPSQCRFVPENPAESCRTAAARCFGWMREAERKKFYIQTSGYTAVNKMNENLTLLDLTFWWGRQTKK